MSDSRWEFFHNQILYLALSAAFQHAKIYAKPYSATDAWALKASLKEKLTKIGECYTASSVPEHKHKSHINNLADSISKEHGPCLKNGRFRIGIAQKALNLYLKSLWCLGKIEEPPHCPFDRQIISRLGLDDPPNWTQIDSMKEYQRLVNAAKAVACGKSLAKWELHAWGDTENH